MVSNQNLRKCGLMLSEPGASSSAKLDDAQRKRKAVEEPMVENVETSPPADVQKVGVVEAEEPRVSKRGKITSRPVSSGSSLRRSHRLRSRVQSQPSADPQEVNLSDSEETHSSFSESLRRIKGEGKKGKKTVESADQVASSGMKPGKVSDGIDEVLDITGSAAAKFAPHGFTDPGIVKKLMELVATLSARQFEGSSRQAHAEACLRSLASEFLLFCEVIQIWSAEGNDVATLKSQLLEAKEREEVWKSKWSASVEESRVLGVQLQAERMEAKELRARLEAAERELAKVKLDGELRLSEALAQAAEERRRSEKDMAIALREAATKAVEEFKASEAFQQCVAAQGQEAMIAMQSKIRAEIRGLSSSFSVEKLESLELLRLWEAVELAMVPSDAVNPAPATNTTTVEAAAEEASSRVAADK